MTHLTNTPTVPEYWEYYQLIRRDQVLSSETPSVTFVSLFAYIGRKKNKTSICLKLKFVLIISSS